MFLEDLSLERRLTHHEAPMDESSTRAAGATHGQKMSPADMEAVIRWRRRRPWQPTALDATAPEERYRASYRRWRCGASDTPQTIPLTG
jgi:FO synthase